MTKTISTERTQLCDLPGLGVKTAGWLGQIGIHTPGQLAAADPFEVYATLKAHIAGINILALYALIGAIEGRHWQDIKRERRTEIVLRLDQMGLAPR